MNDTDKGLLLTCPSCGKKSWVAPARHRDALDKYTPENGSGFFCHSCRTRLEWPPEPIFIAHRHPGWTAKDEEALQAIARAAMAEWEKWADDE